MADDNNSGCGWMIFGVILICVVAEYPKLLIALAILAVVILILCWLCSSNNSDLNDSEFILKQREEKMKKLAETKERNEVKNILIKHRDEAIKCLKSFYLEAFLIMLKHFSVLYTKYKQCMQEDDYGIICDRGWSSEFDYFIKNVLLMEIRNSNTVIYPVKPLMLLWKWNVSISGLPDEIQLKEAKHVTPIVKINFIDSDIPIYSLDDCIGDNRSYIGNSLCSIKKNDITVFDKIVSIVEGLNPNDYQEALKVLSKEELLNKCEDLVRNDNYLTKDKMLCNAQDEGLKLMRINCVSQIMMGFFNLIKERIVASSNLSVENLNPYEFEHYCAESLKELGFEARATKGSGDQGVDVIAEKKGFKVAIQCKLYSNPVGNKAVQEVIAGKQFYNADIGAVVTNASFTPSAKQLASTCDILLLNIVELHKLDEHVEQLSSV